jgi:hypothetical protein
MITSAIRDNKLNFLVYITLCMQILGFLVSRAGTITFAGTQSLGSLKNFMRQVIKATFIFTY